MLQESFIELAAMLIMNVKVCDSQLKTSKSTEDKTFWVEQKTSALNQLERALKMAGMVYKFPVFLWNCTPEEVKLYLRSRINNKINQRKHRLTHASN